MRKFTKEITALIASAAIGTVAGVGVLSASSEEMVETAGVEMIPDETICTTEDELPPLGGVPLLSDEWIEPTTEEEIPPLMGDIAPPDEEELPPVDGGMMPPDDEYFPPLGGVVAIPDGDVNGDGYLSVSDVVLFQKWLLNVPEVNLDCWWAADLCEDGKLDVFDLCLMKKALIESAATSSDIKEGYIAVFHGNDGEIGHETYIYKLDNGAANYGFEYINAEILGGEPPITSAPIVITGSGRIMWTDSVFSIAEANNAYDYVTIPGDDRVYTIEEFMGMFLMD